MNLIVKFNNEEARQEFVVRTREAYPRVLEKGYMAKRRPDLIIQDLPEEDRSLIDELAKGLGRVFEDVKFKTMEPR